MISSDYKTNKIIVLYIHDGLSSTIRSGRLGGLPNKV